MLTCHDWVMENCRFAEKSPQTVSIAVFRERAGKVEVLIGRRACDPEKDEWALPGGHVDDGEKVVDAARRELAEETGVDVENLTFVERRKVDSVFCNKVSSETVAKGASDLPDVKWVDVKSLPDLAFNHADSIMTAYRQLFKK